MQRLSWQANILAAPVVSWVRKHYAEPVTSAAGFVNVGTPGETRERSEPQHTQQAEHACLNCSGTSWNRKDKHWSSLKTVNEAEVTTLSQIYSIIHLFKAQCAFFKSQTRQKKNEYVCEQKTVIEEPFSVSCVCWHVTHRSVLVENTPCYSQL